MVYLITNKVTGNTSECANLDVVNTCRADKATFEVSEVKEPKSIIKSPVKKKVATKK